MTISNNQQVYQHIRQVGTQAPNYDLSTQDILERLTEWEGRCSFRIEEVTPDSLLLVFSQLPEDLDGFVREVYEFCPDTVDQHYGCLVEMVESMEEAGEEIPESLQILLAGIPGDGSEDEGLTLMKRDLQQHHTLSLWWD
ncbi:MAG: DUF4253 domain-containing protein [Cyanobacteriota bacterium]|nr:DUF4253 domain-containing protein [Cyanobacteriota bacterium]